MAAQIRSLVLSSSSLSGSHQPRCSRFLVSRNTLTGSEDGLPSSSAIQPGANHVVLPITSVSSALLCSFSATSHGHAGLISSRTQDAFMPQQDNNGDGVNGSFNGSGGDGGEGDDNGSYDYGGEGGDFSAFFLSAFFRGWNDRANADPHFSFKVFAEEMVSAGATAIAHVTSKKNDCLNELDFVFSAIAVGSILNFCLLYTLAPTSTLGAAPMIFPSMFSHSPPAQMSNRLVIFLNKSAIFTIAGVTQGLLSTIVPNLLIRMRKKLDPCKEVQAKPPPIALNAATCAINMGLGSTFRYQIVGDLEFVMAKVMPAPLVRVSIFGIRTMNIILGGIVFATLARLTGLQKDERGEKSAFVARVTGLQTAEKAEKSGKKADKQEP